MKKTISSQIMDRLKSEKRWWGGNQLETSIYGHKGSSISRIARMMAEEGLIRRDEIKVKGINRPCVQYKTK